MKKTKTLLLLIAILAAFTLTACGGGGGGGGGGAPSGGGGGGPTSVNLPKTGQTNCYDSAGTVIICTSTGQDGNLQKGVAWPSPRFTVDGTGNCVTDNLTGLMWVKIPSGSIATWQNALNYANNLNFCGYTDWRLPNIKELRSLVNYGQANSATWLNNQGLSNVLANYYWSSSTYASNTAGAWLVYMSDGSVSTITKTGNYYAWPVRAGGGAATDLPKTGQTTSYATGDDGDLKAGVAWPSPRFTIDGTGNCVTDNLTGLMWVRNANSGIATWQNALAYANGLTLCGYTDWRLPNVNELDSLINTGEINTANWLISQGFNLVQAGYYWSSSTYAGNTAGAWGVVMDYGGVYASTKTNTYYVWPVRGGQ